MIRVVTLDPFEEKEIQKFCRQLYASFGVGCEHAFQHGVSGFRGRPAGCRQALGPGQRGPLVPVRQGRLPHQAQAQRPKPSNRRGFDVRYSIYGKTLALVSTHPKKDIDEGFRYVSRVAVYHVEHLCELHHCLDPRCSMYPPWTPSYLNGKPAFCTFCRDKSEHKIRMAKS